MDTTSQTTPEDAKENSQEQSPELLKNEGGLLEGGILAKEIGGDGKSQLDVKVDERVRQILPILNGLNMDEVELVLGRAKNRCYLFPISINL